MTQSYSEQNRLLDSHHCIKRAFRQADDAQAVLPLGSAIKHNWDYIESSDTNSTTEVYNYYLNGLTGTLLQTVTIVYTDATKTRILNVTSQDFVS